MPYQYMSRDEVSGALWSQESINLFTCALTHIGPTTTMVICTDYKSKDIFSNETFLEYLYDNNTPKNDEVKEEIIWSYGPISEFKNKYMCHLMGKFSTKYNRGFHGSFQQLLMVKELLMGLTVMSNQLFRVNQWAKERTRSLCRMQSFYQVASKAMNATEVFLIDKTQVEAYRGTDPFNGCQTVPGIMSMHIISAQDDGVKLW